MFVVGGVLFVVCCLVLCWAQCAVRCLLFIVCCLFDAVCCSLCVDEFPLFDGCCALVLFVRCVLSVLCCALCAYCLLFVVCCVLFDAVVCCWLHGV